MIPDHYRSVLVFISDRPFVFIGTDFFRHDFHNGEVLTGRGWNAPILKVIQGVADSYRSAPKP